MAEPNNVSGGKLQNPEDMILEEGELLRIRATDYDSEIEQCRIQIVTSSNGDIGHIKEVLKSVCSQFDMFCIPKDVLISALKVITGSLDDSLSESEKPLGDKEESLK